MPNKRESEYYSSARPSSLDVLIAILEDKEMASSRDCVNLQRAVLRLITYAYVESADQNPVLRINRYRNLDRIMLGNGVDRSGEFDSVIRFIKEVLTNFKSFFALSLEGGGDKPEIIFDSIQRLYTIIELLKSTLINGMWSVTQQQNIILPLLLNILRN